MMERPDTFTEAPEELVSRAMAWEPSEHAPRETVNLLNDLAQALRKERSARATSAEIIRQQNLAYGRLVLEKNTLELEHGLLAGTIEEVKQLARDGHQDMAELQKSFASYIQARGPLARFADWLEGLFGFGTRYRLP